MAFIDPSLPPLFPITLLTSSPLPFLLSFQSHPLPYLPSPFPQFGWTHITLLIVVSQAYLAVQNVFEGLYWFVLPVSIVVCNDIMAYLFGML